MKWTHTIETVVTVEQAQAKGQWRIGDAIKKDIFSTVEKNEENLSDLFEECAERMDAIGQPKYVKNYLGKLYHTAKAFPTDERNSEYSWDIHFEAGTPENLKKAVAMLRKLKQPINPLNMRWLMKEWRDKAKAERKAKNEQAKADKAAAKKKKAEAAAKKLAATDKDEKEKAKQEHEQARQEEKEASQRVAETAKPPGYNADVDTELHDPGTLHVMAIHLGVTTKLQAIERQAMQAVAETSKIIDSLTPVMASAIVDGCNTILEVTDSLKKMITSKKFKVHQGGVA